MFDATMVEGRENLPERTVVLTFDDGPGATAGDGPGPRTAQVAAYLAERALPATFFMCGKHMAAHADVVKAVLDHGHALGNHTYSHGDLTSEPADRIRDELRSTLDLLVAAGASPPFPFRPPSGRWDARCADVLNADAELRDAHVGVFGWDVDGEDWVSWQQAVPDGRGVADAYTSLIAARGRGVVLLHDSSADAGAFGETLRKGNRTLDVVTLIVPWLLDEGFAVAPLSSVAAERWGAAGGLR